jgi:hypothetical protein
MHAPLPVLELFAQVNSNHPRFLDYLKAERDAVRATLSKAEKHSLIFRNQGDLQRLDQLIELLSDSAGHVRKLKP